MEELMRSKLIQLHKDCFHDGSYADYFFMERLEEKYAYVVKVGEEIASACYARIFTLKLAGKEVKVPFLTGVATSPTHRYKGYATEVVNKATSDLEAQGFPFVILHPFNHKFYRKLGFETINYVRDLTPSSNPLRGVEFRKMVKEDIPLVSKLYNELMEREICYRIRDEKETEGLIGYSLNNGGLGYLIFENSVPKGYVWCEDGACVEALAEREDLFGGLSKLIPYTLPIMGGERDYSMGKPLSLKSLFECLPYSKEANGKVNFAYMGKSYCLRVKDGAFLSLTESNEDCPTVEGKTLIQISLGQGDKVAFNPFKEVIPNYNLACYEIY